LEEKDQKKKKKSKINEKVKNTFSGYCRKMLGLESTNQQKKRKKKS